MKRRCCSASVCSGTGSGPSSIHRLPRSASEPNTRLPTRHCSQIATCACAHAEPINPPVTAPTDHQAWNAFKMERPYRCCTRKPWAFIAMSVTESADIINTTPTANTAALGALPRMLRQRIPNVWNITATPADWNRRISFAVNMPSTRPAIGPSAMMNPHTQSRISSDSLISGKRGSSVDHATPFSTKHSVTPQRARRTSVLTAVKSPFADPD